MVHVNGDLDPAGGLVVLEALRSLSEPANLDPGDTRTPAQARADALVGDLPPVSARRREGKKHPPTSWSPSPGTPSRGKGIVDTEAGPISGKPSAV